MFMRNGCEHPVRLMLYCFAVTVFIGLSGCAGDGTVVFHVSTEGDDAGVGTVDRPFASFERARDAVRELKLTDTGKGNGAVIEIHGGTYEMRSSFALTESDSGLDGVPVIWRAHEGDTVVLSGGGTVRGFNVLTDEKVRGRLNEDARSHVLWTDLAGQGITDYGDIKPDGGNRTELFFKGSYMTLARYPNEDWLTIADVPQNGPKMLHPGLDRDKSAVPRGRHYGRFTYDGNRPERWSEADDIWMHGFWVWDWRDEYLPVERIDTRTKAVYPREPHHASGYQKGQRYYFLNILEELDSPGEYYIDRDQGILYFWPPEQISDGDVTMPVVTEPLITMDNVSNVTISGLTFAVSRGSGVSMTGGSGNLVAGCDFHNLGDFCVVIDGGTNNGVKSCDMYEVGRGGVILDGGDRKTLTPAGNYAENNHIHHFARRIKTYQAGVQITGVGNRASHNLIHDSPHTGIFLVTSRVGNDHIIEYNELHHLAQETGDVGAIYLCGRNFTFRGTVIRHNYLHHLLGPGLHGVMAVYLDDFTSGTTVYGNVFYKAGRAGFIGGGRDNTIENNLFVECAPSVHLDARGIGWASYYFKNSMETFNQQLDDVSFREPPYSERYPGLLTLMDDEPAIPKGTRILYNVSQGGRWFDLYDHLDFDVFEMTGNYVADPMLVHWLRKGEDKFRDYDSGNEEIKTLLQARGNVLADQPPVTVSGDGDRFDIPEGSPVFDTGFKPIPFDRIGLYVDEYRTSLPE